MSGLILPSGSSLGTLTGPIASDAGTARVSRSGDAFPLNPFDLFTAPKLWLRADSCASVGNGNTVQTWADRTGNGYNATQATAGRRPTYIASAIGGMPALRFNVAGNTGLFTTSSCGVTAGNNHSGFIVLNSSAFTADSSVNLFAWWNSGYFLIQQRGKISQLTFLDSSGRFDVCAPLPLNTNVIISWVSSATGVLIRINGQTVIDLQNNRIIYAAGAASGVTAAINTANIGSGSGGGQNFAGDIAEVIAYDTALSPAERAGVEAYLSSRYSIPIYNNWAVPKRAVLFGDSRSVGLNYSLGAMRYNLGLGWYVVGGGISGNTAAQMAARVQTDAIPYYDSGLTKNVLVVWGGDNSLLGSVTGAAVYTDITAIVAAGLARGFQVVVCTEIDMSTLSGPQQTQRAALNVLIAANTAGATAVCDLAATALGTWSGTYFADFGHPNALGGSVIGAALAATVAAL